MNFEDALLTAWPRSLQSDGLHCPVCSGLLSVSGDSAFCQGENRHFRIPDLLDLKAEEEPTGGNSSGSKYSNISSLYNGNPRANTPDNPTHRNDN
jgi:hypothetical protein